MYKKFLYFAVIFQSFFFLFKLHPVYAHFVEKPNGHLNVSDLLKPDDDITFLEKIGIYCVDGLLIILAITLISMLIRRKKAGKILILFLIVLVVDCFIVLHYGSAFDLLG